MLAAAATRAEAALHGYINELRYQLFCAKRGAASQVSCHHAETASSYTQRANFQAAICGRCLEAKTQRAIEHGWTERDSKLNIFWMRSVSAPEVVLKLLACKC